MRMHRSAFPGSFSRTYDCRIALYDPPGHRYYSALARKHRIGGKVADGGPVAGGDGLLESAKMLDRRTSRGGCVDCS